MTEVPRQGVYRIRLCLYVCQPVNVVSQFFLSHLMFHPSYPNHLAQGKPLAIDHSHNKLVSAISTFDFLGPGPLWTEDPYAHTLFPEKHQLHCPKKSPFARVSLGIRKVWKSSSWEWDTGV